MTKKILSFIAMALIFVACEKSKNDDPEMPNQTPSEEVTADFTAYGLVSVPVPSQEFTMDNVRVEAKLKEGDMMDIYFYDVSFSSRMPLISLVIPDVSYIRTEEQITFAGNDIVPTMRNAPVSKYTVTDLQGTVTPDELALSCSFGGIACTYQGAITTE